MKIDEEDKKLIKYACREVYTSKHSNTRYVMTKISKRTAYVHRLIAEAMLKRKFLKNERVDHINGDGTDNRRENLRICTHHQNMGNQPARRNGSSKYKGVSKTRTGNWAVRIWNNYKCINIGTFSNEREAGKAYNEQAIKYFGEYAKLNQL